MSFTPSWTHRPDAETLASVRRMCARLMQQPDLFAETFRDNFALASTGGPRPDPATGEAAVQLAETVVSLIVMGSDPEDPDSVWPSAAGGRAARLPSEDLITVVVKSLVRSVRDVLGDEWSSATGSQWAAMQMWLVPQLTAGAYQARAAGLAAPLAVAPSAAHDVPGEPWPAPAPAADDGQDPASRHDRKRRGSVRRTPDGGAEWVP